LRASGTSSRRDTVLNTYEYDRGGLFGNRWRLPFWLLPLALGVGIGALAFGILPGIWPAFDDRAGGRHRHGFYAPRFRQEAEPGAGAVSPAPHAKSPARQGQMLPAGTSGERGHDILSWLGVSLFAPLLGLRWLLPFLLIGAGAWLLGRRPGGAGGPGTGRSREPEPGRSGIPPTSSAQSAVQEPSGDSDRPATGETRRL